MEKIIEKLYDFHINTSNFPFGKPCKENMDREWELYNFLFENLSEEHRKIFLEYVELHGIRQNEESKVVYEYGFKTAVRLITESLKE